MLGLKLNHVSKRDPKDLFKYHVISHKTSYRRLSRAWDRWLRVFQMPWNCVTAILLPRRLRNFKPIQFFLTMFSISTSPYDTRGGIKLIQPRVNSTRNGLKSFRNQGAKIWNELPTSVKNTDVSEFKYRLNEWVGQVCKCGSCELCKFINIWTAFCHSPLILYAHMILLSWGYIYIYTNDLYICVCIYLYACMCALLFMH